MKDEWHEIHTKARRPAPHRAWLCGPFRLERCVGDGYEPVGQWEWGGRTSPRTVLKALLCAPGRQMRRSALAAQLWPETTEVQASREMSVALTFLRKVLRSDDGKEVLEEEGTKGLRLAGQSALWVDADAAAHLLDQAEQMGEHSPTALPLLEKAFSYFERGPFLADDEGEWLVARRAMGERRQYRCRLQLADLYGQQGRIERAETLLNDLLSDDPTDEDVICRLMLLLQQHGFTHQALLVYRQACALFQEEGLELTEATRELATQLTRERYISPVKLIPPQAPALALSPAHFIPSELIVDEEPGKRNGEMVQLFSLVPPRIDLFSVALMGLLLAQHQYRWTLDELRWQIERGMGFFDHMNQKTQAHVSRREALTFLACVPLALWGLPEINGASSPVDPKDILPLYAASIPACWNLFFSGHLAEVAKILPACLSQLTTLAEQPSIHRKSAAGLASQAYQLAALFAKEVQEDFGASFAHCKQALAYAQLAEDHSLIAASFIREVDALFCRNRYAQIHQVLQQAEYSTPEASPLMRGRIYCHLAVSSAKHEQEQEALRYIELAQDTFPAHPESDPGFLYTHTDYYILYLNKMALFLHLNRPQEAWQAIVRAGNFVPNNVSPRRAELLSETVTASLALNDLEQSCFYFEKLAMLGTALGANLFISEAQTSYQEMQMKWPHETRIKSLGKLFAKEDRKERI